MYNWDCLSLVERQKRMREKQLKARRKRWDEARSKSPNWIKHLEALKDYRKMDRKVITFSVDSQQQRQQRSNLPRHRKLKEYCKKGEKQW